MNDRAVHIFLIGMMGAGKSSVGRRLAGILHRDFIDLDTLIEAESGKSIPEIFQEEGEAEFRRRETETARKLDLRRPAVIAAGGGFPLREENMRWMKANGRVIWLRAGSGSIRERLRHEERPLLPLPVKKEAIEKILSRRIPVYREAEMSFDTENQKPEVTAKKIAEALQ